MKPETEPAQSSRQRVLQAAEQLFSEHGYAAVTLRDIADALGIKQASLYYHAPGGKEELFVQVTERGLKRHQQGLESAIASAGMNLRDQLQAAARWLLSQPALNYGRMLQSDMRAISPHEAERLRVSAYRSLIAPLTQVFAVVQSHSSDHAAKTVYLAGAFLSIIEGIHNLPTTFSDQPKEAMADYLIDTWLNGLQPGSYSS
ncbi:MAG: TetR/AcrR family transcriptional regulator [Anaerolineae bacterium]|nr:TetR/AcrR family transcriptional regulator [Anaerolineae bacterium]MBN8618079.1 TetR/AcrR family transcriptional regulator [Anaerolineae bacterium]